MKAAPFSLPTPRLLLRDLIESDWTAVFAMSREATVVRFQSLLRLDDEDAARHWVMEAMYHNSLPLRQSYNLAVVERASGQVICWLGWGRLSRSKTTKPTSSPSAFSASS